MRVPFTAVCCLLVCPPCLSTTLSSTLSTRFSNISNNCANCYFLLVHITDIHLDPLFSPVASELQYCHHGTTNNRSPFGVVGNVCDSPSALVDGTFDYLIKHEVDEKTDFILWTGDSSRHDRDPDLRKDSSEIYSQNSAIVSKFLLAFGTNKPILPTIGNHDVSPGDKLAAGPNEALTKLWDVFSPLFHGYVDYAKVQEDFLNGGYYVYDIDESVSVVSLNTMYWFEKNNAVLDCNEFGGGLPPVGSTIPGDEHFVWLNKVLNDRKARDMKVIMIGHIPPTDSQGTMLYYKTCYNNFVHTLGHFSTTIISTHFGHTNRDSIALILQNTATKTYNLVAISDTTVYNVDLVNNKVVHTIMNSASIVPVYNPSFKSYKISLNGTSTGLLESKQHHLDINRANRLARDGQERVELTYDSSKCSSRKNFKLESLSPTSIQLLIQRIQKAGKRGGEESNLIRRYMRCMYANYYVDEYEDRLLLTPYEIFLFLVCTCVFFLTSFIGIWWYMRSFEMDVMERQRLLFRDVGSSRDRYDHH